MNPLAPSTDPLTGLLTRKGFREAFAEQLALARSMPVERPLSLAFFDIDHFLEINNQYGHASGDQVLLAVTAVIRQISGGSAILGRYGGDEFALLLPGTEREQAFLVMEHIRTTLAQHSTSFVSGQALEGIPISGGLASFPVDGRTEVELLRKADQAMYRAKESGRSRIRLAYEERMVPKTAHFTHTQLERLSKLAEAHGVSEADLLREAMDDLLTKYGVNDVES